MAEIPMLKAARVVAAQDFLAAAGWAEAVMRPLAGDASFRRYFRLEGVQGRAVLMDAPPETGEDCRPFVALAQWFAAQGYSAPRLLAIDLDRGFLLLEDLGDALYRPMIAAGADEALLYETAVDLLLDLHGHPVPQRLPLPGGAHVLPAHSLDVLLTGAMTLLDWYLPEITGALCPETLRADYLALWRAALAPVAAPRRSILVHRDFHADNLLWLGERQGLARIGLLDFQDASAGHPAYDLVSLLADARRDVAPELAADLMARYVAAARARDRGFDADAFAAACALLGAQRNCRILGVFARLWRRDGKPAYLGLMPRVWRHLAADLAHPALAELRRFLDAAVPPARRARPLSPTLP
jgi:hypothetical protein